MISTERTLALKIAYSESRAPVHGLTSAVVVRPQQRVRLSARSG
jgi:hypothetical protein